MHCAGVGIIRRSRDQDPAHRHRHRHRAARRACCSPPPTSSVGGTRPWTDGVQVDALRDLDVLFVQTMNTVYDITVVTRADRRGHRARRQLLSPSRRAP